MRETPTLLNTFPVIFPTVFYPGANTGIGKETALELGRRGARLMLLCRDLEKADAAKEEIAKETGGAVETMKLDLSSLRSIRECAEKILEKEDKIHILVNNAGVMVSLNLLQQLSLLQCFFPPLIQFQVCPNWKTEDGFDMQFGTNHLGHFLLTELLLPLVKKAATDDFRPR